MGDLASPLEPGVRGTTARGRHGLQVELEGREARARTADGLQRVWVSSGQVPKREVDWLGHPAVDGGCLPDGADPEDLRARLLALGQVEQAAVVWLLVWVKERPGEDICSKHMDYNKLDRLVPEPAHDGRRASPAAQGEVPEVAAAEEHDAVDDLRGHKTETDIPGTAEPRNTEQEVLYGPPA